MRYGYGFLIVLTLLLGCSKKLDKPEPVAVAADGQSSNPPSTPIKVSAETLDQATEILKSAINLKPTSRSGDRHRDRAIGGAYYDVRRDAARELLHDAHAPAAEFLFKYATSQYVSSNNEIMHQTEVLVELHSHNPKMAEEAIAKILKEHGLYFRFHGVTRALWKIDPRKARTELESALERTDWQVVRGFVEATQEYAPEQLERFLIPMFRHKDSRIKRLAAIKLAKGGNSIVIETLKKMLTDDSTHDIDLLGDDGFAVRALGHLWEKGGKVVLVDLLDSANQERLSSYRSKDLSGNNLCNILSLPMHRIWQTRRALDGSTFNCLL